MNADHFSTQTRITAFKSRPEILDMLSQVRRIVGRELTTADEITVGIEYDLMGNRDARNVADRVSRESDWSDE